MDTPIHEWLKQDQYSRWVCADMQALIDELAAHGNVVRAVGLANIKCPEAVVLLSHRLNEQLVKTVASAHPCLQLHYNGIGELYSVICPEHYVYARFSYGDV